MSTYISIFWNVYLYIDIKNVLRYSNIVQINNNPTLLLYLHTQIADQRKHMHRHIHYNTHSLEYQYTYINNPSVLYTVYWYFQSINNKVTNKAFTRSTHFESLTNLVIQCKLYVSGFFLNHYDDANDPNFEGEEDADTSPAHSDCENFQLTETFNYLTLSGDWVRVSDDTFNYLTLSGSWVRVSEYRSFLLCVSSCWFFL